MLPFSSRPEPTSTQVFSYIYRVPLIAGTLKATVVLSSGESALSDRYSESTLCGPCACELSANCSRVAAFGH